MTATGLAELTAIASVAALVASCVVVAHVAVRDWLESRRGKR